MTCCGSTREMISLTSGKAGGLVVERAKVKMEEMFFLCNFYSPRRHSPIIDFTFFVR